MKHIKEYNIFNENVNLVPFDDNDWNVEDWNVEESEHSNKSMRGLEFFYIQFNLKDGRVLNSGWDVPTTYKKDGKRVRDDYYYYSKGYKEIFI